MEEYNGELFAYEIKLRKKKIWTKAPKTWIDNYGTNFRCITTDNFWEFLT